MIKTPNGFYWTGWVATSLFGSVKLALCCVAGAYGLVRVRCTEFSAVGGSRAE